MSSYEPYDHREQDNPINNFEVVVHIVKGTLGSGILAMPDAFKNAGLIAGVAESFVLAFIASYCILVLTDACYLVCKQKQVGLLTYPASMQAALEVGPEKLQKMAQCSYYAVDTFICLYQVGVGSAYAVFIAENLKQVTDPTYNLDVRIWLAMLTLPLLLINSVRNLKYLAPFSIIANVVTFISIILIYVEIFEDFPTIEEPRLDYVAHIYFFPLFFGTAFFSFGAIGVVSSVENNMATPGSFNMLFSCCMLFIAVLSIVTGFVGYAKYGNDIEGSITLNLKERAMGVSVKIMYSLAIFLSHALNCFVPINIILTTYLAKRIEESNSPLLIEFSIRYAFVLLTVLLAAVIPHLGIIISLVGSSCLSMLVLAFPAIMDICIRYVDGYGRCRWYLVRDIFIILFGIVALITGTGVSLKELIEAYTKDHTPVTTTAAPTNSSV